jgi:hypothetical protein
MAIFKSDPEKTLQRSIDAAVATHERLKAKLFQAEEAVTCHTVAAKQSALKGDDGELDRAEVSLRTAQDRCTTLKAALAEIEQQLAALQHSKAEMADRKLREATAAEIELTVRKMTEVAAEFDAAAANLFEYTRRAVPVIWEARGLHDFIAICRAQVPSTVEMVGTLLRAHSDAVVAGTAPATLPSNPDDVPVAEAVAEPTTPQSPFTYHAFKGGPTYRGAVRQ